MNFQKLKHRTKRMWQKDLVFWLRYRKKILYWTFAIFHVLGFFSSINAIMQTRTPQGAIAWAVSLNTFPYIAVPAYWIFGASEFEDYFHSREESRQAAREIRQELRTRLIDGNMLQEPDDVKDRVLASLAEQPFTRGNQVELLTSGAETYESMLEGIESAKHYILFQFYIIRDDDIGRRFRDALARKAREGVKVYAMYDEIGSLGLPSDFGKPITDAGSEFVTFNTTEGFMNRLRLNFRNHRKIVVIDGQYAWTGGNNIGEEYTGTGENGSEFYRDTHIKMSGPVVQMVQSVFVEDWYWVKRGFPELDWQPDRSEEGDLKMLCLASGPSDTRETCALFYLTAINSAQKRIWISSPYFVPDQQIFSALALAVLRGVDVRIMVPRTTDLPLTNFSHLGILGETEKSGVNVYAYEKGFNHQKVMLVDDQYSYIGSANFDNRSFRLNFEITMVVDDKDFAVKTEAMLEKDFEYSPLVPPDTFRESNFFRRLIARTALLLAPIQ